MRSARAAEGVGPYGGADSPEIGNQINVFCRVVEDADPYEMKLREALLPFLISNS